MTSVAPPPPPPPPSGPQNAPQLTVNLGSQAQILAKLPLDSLFQATVKSPSGQQPLSVQTNMGALTFKAPFHLPNGAQATFKLITPLPNAQIQLTHINGTPVAPQTPAARVLPMANQIMGLQSQSGQAGMTSSPGLQSAPPGLSNLATSNPAAILSMNNMASGLRAIVLSLVSPPQGTAPSQMTNPAGQMPPGPGQPMQASQAQPGAGGSQSPPSTQSLSIQGQAQSIQPGSQLNLRIASVTLPSDLSQGGQNVPKAGASTPGILTGSVQQGATPSGQPVVKIPQGLIALDTLAKFPEGTQLKLEVLSASKPETATLGPASPAMDKPSLASLTKSWPALQETLDTLKATNPAVAENLMQKTLARPDSSLSANMLFFLKALGRGNFKIWSDDQTLRALNRVKPGLANRLEEDFKLLSKKAATPNANDWKIAFVPLQDQGQIQQIRIAQRDHKDEEQQGREDPGVRFVIDIDLSEFGPMQLDGLAKDRDKKCDLIIRTKATLPGHVRKDIHDIYENGLETINFEGKLSFLVTQNFVEVEGFDLGPDKLNLGMLV